MWINGDESGQATQKSKYVPDILNISTSGLLREDKEQDTRSINLLNPLKNSDNPQNTLLSGCKT